MEVVWNGTRSGGLNPSIHAIGEPYQPPALSVQPAPVAPVVRGWSRDTRVRVLEYLGTVPRATAAEICEALGVEDRLSKRRINSMAVYLYQSGLLRASKHTGISPRGRGFRFHIYSLVRP